jgi:hypothetical protein
LGLAETASSIDLPTISPTAPRDALWQHTCGQWATDLLWLGGLTLAFFIGTVVRLSRRLNQPD